MNLIPFTTWPEVMEYARQGRPLYYKAPMDQRATRLLPGANTPAGYEARGRTIKIWPYGSIGRGKARTSDPFSADSGHLERFSRPDEGARERAGVTREMPRRGRTAAPRGRIATPRAREGGSRSRFVAARLTPEGPEVEEIGHIGDVNWAEYGGGPIYRRVADDDYFLEYIEPPTDDIEFTDPEARWIVYRVELEPEVPSWAADDLNSIADSTDQDVEELRGAFTSTNPIDRAWAYETVASYWGWENFDSYPLSLTCAEMNARYDAGIDCGGEESDVVDEPRRGHRTSESSFKKGDRIMWSDSFLKRGREIDPKWYALRKNERGTVDWIQRDGDVIVQWDGEHNTTVHPPARLALATDRMLEDNRGGLRTSEARVSEPNDARDVLEGLGPYLEHEGHDAPRVAARIASMIARAGRSGKKAEAVLEEVDKLIDGHGVEAIRDENEYDSYYGDVIATYVNMGDTYDTTLVYDVRAGTFHVTSWGDWYEAWERRRDEDDDS